jgi:hypothetical protein
MLTFAMAAVACASSRLVLEKPVADQCMSAGLKGCPHITEGILLYVEGEKAQGAEKLERGIAQNKPKELQEFAGTLQTLSSLPGADSLWGP